FTSDSDTEVIAHLLVNELMRNDLEQAIRETMRKLVGSYSLVILIEDKVIGVRDPLGFKPLCIGRLENGYVLASESCAIDTLNGELVRDVAPGEMVVLGDRIESYKLFHSRSRAHCMFEFVYVARPDSIMDGRLIYKVRHRIGEELARECPTAADIVSPVPDSGITSAIGYAGASGVRYAEGMIKNRYIGRTFIMPGQEEREKSVRRKLNAIDLEFRGKTVLLVDDSIVRGTTSAQIIELAREAGAAKVYFASAAPPVRFPNVYGIDMPAASELVASGRSVEEISRLIGADWLVYQDLEDLIVACKHEDARIEEFDTSCFSGVYVTGDVTPEYLERLQDERSDAAKLERRARRKLKVVRGS
ncbi:MAG TPA: amidophosphoribosyltransferase, partial [Steroidobacteraceae bacterium]|nr:amidophosphoribosyltransferase [Steroidobacteraceae bacterium]